MKKRFSILFTLTAAAVLVSSLAYASKKKLQSNKSEHLKQDMSEVDLAANLLDTSTGNHQKSQNESYSKKHDDEKLKDLTMTDKSKSQDKATGR